jgi:hypothetical protein
LINLKRVLNNKTIDNVNIGNDFPLISTKDKIISAAETSKIICK